MRGGRKDDLQAIRYFEVRTGKTDWTADEVAEFIEKNNVMEMPEARTSRQILAARLAKSAGSERRTDHQSDVAYRAYYSIRVEKDGQVSFRWFDADGPGCTEETLLEATRRRKEQALGIGVGVTSDWKHFLRTHPDAKGSMPDFDLNWEIQLRLGEQDEQEGENRKAG